MIRFESGAALLLQLNVLTPGSDACFINHPACPYKVRPQRGCCPDAVVSIHAPRFRGAMHLPYMHNLSRSERFNPRSPFPGSDAFMVLLSFGRVVKFQSTLPVSEERCDIERCVGVGNDKVSIHAPRFRGAMRVIARTAGLSYHGFNPRSPFPGSDAGCRVVFGYLKACFNPRSPFPGSDASHQERHPRASEVSIHAPRFRGAMRRSKRG